jgi:hypothetical protein
VLIFNESTSRPQESVHGKPATGREAKKPESVPLVLATGSSLVSSQSFHQISRGETEAVIY